MYCYLIKSICGDNVFLYVISVQVEAVSLLTPKQSAELVVLPLAEKDVVINAVFDYLTASPKERGLAEFVSHLVMFSVKVQTILLLVIIIITTTINFSHLV